MTARLFLTVIFLASLISDSDASSRITTKFQVNGFHVTSSEDYLMYSDYKNEFNPVHLVVDLLEKMKYNSSNAIGLSDVRTLIMSQSDFFLRVDTFTEFDSKGFEKEVIGISIFMDFQLHTITEIHAAIIYVQKNFFHLLSELGANSKISLTSAKLNSTLKESIKRLDSLNVGVPIPNTRLSLLISQGRYQLSRRINPKLISNGSGVYTTKHLKGVYTSPNINVFVGQDDSLTFYETFKSNSIGTHKWDRYSYSLYSPLRVHVMDSGAYILLRNEDKSAVFSPRTNSLVDLKGLLNGESHKMNEEDGRPMRLLFLLSLIVSTFLFIAVWRRIII